MWRVEFADIVARLDLSWLIARYELYKLEKQRYWWETSTALFRFKHETGERRVSETRGGYSRRLQPQVTVSTRRDSERATGRERTRPRLGRKLKIKIVLHSFELNY